MEAAGDWRNLLDATGDDKGKSGDDGAYLHAPGKPALKFTSEFHQGNQREL